MAKNNLRNEKSLKTKCRKYSKLKMMLTGGLIETDQPDYEMYGYDRLKEIIFTNNNLSISEFNEKLIEEVKKFSNQNFDDHAFVLSI